MAEILTFRTKESASSGQDFLTDENEKLSFRTAADGAVSIDDMSRAPLPDLYPDPRKDWSNQELADLFRVHRLLNGANVAVETMRGITDEGDPWFIFCHFNGDVFIHMARIDGTYVLDSPNVQRPLRGNSFNALISDFTNQALPSAKETDGDTERRVIRLERGGKVSLHPSAMLAALIWTLFLSSEDLVLLAPDEEAAGGDDLLDFTDVVSAGFDFEGFEMETADAAEYALPEVAADIAMQNSATPETHMQMRDILGQQGLAMHQNAFAMGLSTIAIAMGFMSEAVLLDNQRKVLEGLKSLNIAQYDVDGDATPQLEQIADAEGNNLVDMLAEFLGLDLSLNTDMAEAPATPDDTSLLQQQILEMTEAGADAPLVSFKSTQTVVKNHDDIELSETPSADTQPLETMIVNVQQQDRIDPDMSDIIDSQSQMEEFQLGKTTVMASFDLNNSDVFALSDYIFAGQRTTNHREFNQQAQSFIDYIQAKESEVGIITTGNEIIMIDSGAFLADGAETYSFSWETYDGQIISLIGLRSEFQQFDLIA